MPTSTLTAVDIVNQALRNLGDDPISSLGDTTRRAQIANQFYATVRDATLTEHPWNFAMVRTELFSYQTPAGTLTPGATSGTGVTFTASVAGTFVAADVGREIRRVGGGKARIVGFTSGVLVTADITVAFPSVAAIPSGTWRLYYHAPSWGATYRTPVPADALRVWRLEDNHEYQVEAGFIVTNQEALRVRYVKQETDTTRYSFPFVLALTSHLTSILAEPITGQAQKQAAWFQIYGQRLLRAKAMDGQEGTPEQLDVNTLIDVR
jgi:hypothetical protein